MTVNRLETSQVYLLYSSTITASSNSVSKKSSYKDFQQDIAESERVEKQGCKRPKMER